MNERIDKNIDKGIDDILHHVCNKHNKILSIRFDVRYPSEYGLIDGNKDISHMMAKFIQHYERIGIDIYYIWVREQESSDKPHYHCNVFIDGNKTLSREHIFANASKYWQSTINSDNNGLIDHCTKSRDGTTHQNGIVLNRSQANYQDNLMQVKRQLSYLTKAQGKGEYKDGLRNFGMSRIK